MSNMEIEITDINLSRRMGRRVITVDINTGLGLVRQGKAIAKNMPESVEAKRHKRGAKQRQMKEDSAEQGGGFYDPMGEENDQHITEMSDTSPIFTKPAKITVR